MKLWSRKRWIALIVALPVAFAAVSWFFAVRFTSRVPRASGSFDEWLPPATERVQFSATDAVKLSGWFVPRPDTTRAAVLLHGHWGHRRQMLARAKLLHAQGYAVLLYDARGHGESDGNHVTLGWHETRDLLGALDYLRGRGFKEFGLLGASQGAATIALAAQHLHDVRWAVLESSYPTLHDAVDCRFRDVFGFPGWLGGMLMLPFAEWRLGVRVSDIAPLEHIGALRCATFVLHGENDRHTLSASARQLFERVRAPKSFWLVPGAGHVDLYGFAKADYERRLLKFIGEASVPPASIAQ